MKMHVSSRALTLALALGLCWSGGHAAAADKPSEQKFEMMTYYMGLISRGPSWTPEVTPEVKRIHEGHMANIGRMADTGKLVLAGPFMNDGKLRGIFLFKTSSAEEAQALVANDPAVQAGRLAVELIPWYGPVGIQIVQPPVPPPSEPASTPAQEGAIPLPTER